MVYEAFYLRYCRSDVKVQRSVALLPWSHNVYLLGKNLNDSATLYYAQETIEKGWNRDLLLNAIKLNMYESQLATKVDNNFNRTLPMEQAKYANFFAFRGADGHRGRTLQST